MGARSGRWVVLLLSMVWLATNATAGLAGSRTGGDELWANVFAGAKRFNIPTAISVSPDGSTVYVTGSTGQGYEIDIMTAAFDAVTGDLRWAARYDRGVQGADSGVDLAVSPDGSVVYVGGTSSGGSTSDYLALAYDAGTGFRRWVSRYDGIDHSEDEVDAVAVSPDGTQVFLTGWTTAGGHWDYGTVAFDAASGHRAWAAVLPSTGSQRNEPADLAVAPDGQSVYVTGKDYEAGGSFDYTTVAYSTARGHRRWIARYDRSGTSGSDAASSLAVSPDGALVVVTGTSDATVTTIAYDSVTGHQSWLAQDDATLFAPPPRLVLAPDGTAVYTVFSTGDVATDAFDAHDGTLEWTARYDGPAGTSDEGRAITITPDGSQIIVAGTVGAAAPTYGEFATLAYGPGGESLWTALWDGPAEGGDWPTGAAASPSGSSVFVTGQTWSAPTEAAWGTVAYATG